MYLDPGKTNPTDQVDLYCSVNTERKPVQTAVPFAPNLPKQICIRIPALMFVRYSVDQTENVTLGRDIREFMLRDYRKQLGIHAFVGNTLNSDRAPVRFQKTTEDDRLKYYSHHKCAKVASIYPCFREQAIQRTRFDIVFGLCFLPQQTKARQRTWGRYRQKDTGNMYSFDITSRMFDLKYKDNTNPGDHYDNKQLFPEVKPFEDGQVINDEPCSVAFYVCEGARVWLTDHRHLDVDNKNQTRYQDGTATDRRQISHCRSLCQQGSVIIVRGVCKYGVGIQTGTRKGESSSGTDKTKGEAKGTAKEEPKGTAKEEPEGKAEEELEKKILDQIMSHYFYFFCTSPVVKPDIGKSQLDFNEKNMDANRVKRGENHFLQLRDLKDKVIFLGAADSQYNSACWEISVQRDEKKGNDHYCFVHGCDGSVIVDIAPWRMGFELIYWRQRYERLHKSVVIGLNAQDFGPSMTFEVPAEPYYLERILGIKSRVRSVLARNQFQVYVPEDRRGVRDQNNQSLKNDDIDVRKYIASHEEGQRNLLLRDIEVRSKVPNYKIFDKPDAITRLPPLPLYPPYMLVKEPKEYVYLSNNEKVVSIGDGYYKIEWNDPTVPTDPTVPAVPTDPTGSTAPSAPTGPTDPSVPTDPTGASVSTDPTGPTGPTVPTAPTLQPTMDRNQLFKLARASVDAPYWKYTEDYDLAKVNDYRLGSDYYRYVKVSEQGREVQKVETFCLDQVDAPEEKARGSTERSSKSSSERKKREEDRDEQKKSSDSRKSSSHHSSRRSSSDHSKGHSKQSTTGSRDSHRGSKDSTGSGHRRHQSSDEKPDDKHKSGQTSGESSRQSSRRSSKEDPKSQSKKIKTEEKQSESKYSKKKEKSKSESEKKSGN